MTRHFDLGPVERISEPRTVTEGGFTALVRAWKVGDFFYPELIPSYTYDKLGAAIDRELAPMIQARFDGDAPHESERRCLDAAEDRFRAGVRSVLGGGR